MNKIDSVGTLRTVAVVRTSNKNKKLKKSLKKSFKLLDKLYRRYNVEEKLKNKNY